MAQAPVPTLCLRGPSHLTQLIELGHGSYSRVYSATSPGGTTHAVKCNIKAATVSGISCLKEADLLCRLRGHPYIVEVDHLIHGQPFSAPISPIQGPGLIQDNLNFVLPLAYASLYNHIHTLNYKDRDYYYHCSMYFLVHTLLGVEHLHALGLIHRDLKPGNILIVPRVSENEHLGAAAQVCDFGLVRFNNLQMPPTPQVGTWIYRAPEIVLALPGMATPVDPDVILPPWVNQPYTNKVDVWSLGCILFELLARRPMWYSEDTSPYTILSYIYKHSSPRPCRSDYARPAVMVDGRRIGAVQLNFDLLMRPERSYKEQLDLNTEQIGDLERSGYFKYSQILALLSDMLQFNPCNRLNITQVLDHPALSTFRVIIGDTRAMSARLRERKIGSAIGPVPTIQFIACQEREFVLEEVIAILQVELYRVRYSKRSLFQALQWMDCYLIYRSRLPEQCPSHTLPETKLHFHVCLYMAAKLFTLECLPPFDRWAAAHFTDPIDVAAAMAFELMLCDQVLNWNLHQPTILEGLDEFEHVSTDIDVLLLAQMYLQDQTLNGLTIRQGAQYYLEQTYGPAADQ